MFSAGWVWLGASERGAFGFSNEKSFTYCPSTLSCGRVCWSCGGCEPWPPLVLVMKITSARETLALPYSAAWLTHDLGPGQGSRQNHASKSCLRCAVSAPPVVDEV